MKLKALLLLVLLGTVSAQETPPQPDVLLFAPGIVAREIPVKLTNIDNVRYAPDGRLFAAGYDGRVHVLTDTDGDGLEDKVTPYWDKRGELLTPVGMEIAPEGVYIASRGRISLLKDADGDGIADVAETVVSGWVQEKHNGNSRNDASGIALDAKGNLYFSLGCSDYTNPFLVDKEGVAHYDLKNERGTILKVSPDRKTREIVCTGIRFAVGLAFNKHGDLFATDQEGDTWFPGGNPLDELLHIVPGRTTGSRTGIRSTCPTSSTSPRSRSSVRSTSPRAASRSMRRSPDTRASGRRSGKATRSCPASRAANSGASPS